MSLTRIIFASALVFGFNASAQAEEPCVGSGDNGWTSFFAEFGTFLAASQQPCQELQNQIASVEQQIAQTRQDLEAATREKEFWRQEASRYMDGMSAIMRTNFGDNVVLTSAGISAQLVLDALVVGKVFQGGKAGVAAMRSTGAVRSAMVLRLKKEFTEALYTEVLSKGNDVLNGIQGSEWSWWDLVPFVVPVKKYANIMGTPEAVETLGDASIEASMNSYDANDRVKGAEEKLEELQARLGGLREQLGRCQARTGS